jgi:riboflavin kinase/FMN adenylyltransferase
MAVFYDTGSLPRFDRAVVTIGTFDGVHAGHKTILEEVVAHARSVGGESVLVTFDPHPRKVLFPGQPLGIITPLYKKLELIQGIGIQHIVVVPFTHEFAGLSAQQYIADFLVRLFSPHSIIIGYDHRFGHDRTGNIALLQQMAPVYQFEVVEIAAKLIEEAAVSSTKIRNAVVAGNIEDANSMLGRQFSFSGKVVHGKKLGRTIGYPTTNLQLTDEEQVLPGNGVYTVIVSYANELYGGMMSIGLNPTVTESSDLKIEVNIFDFDKDIYDEEIEVFVLSKLRNEFKFNNLNDLVSRLAEDKKQSVAILEHMKLAGHNS